MRTLSIPAKPHRIEPQVTTTPTPVLNEINDQYDDANDDHFKDFQTLQDQQYNALNSWRSTCIDPLSTPYLKKHFVKICEIDFDKFQNATKSYRSTNMDYPRFLKIHQANQRYKRAVCDFCVQIMSWFNGTVTEKDPIKLISAIKADFTPMIQQIN